MKFALRIGWIALALCLTFAVGCGVDDDDGDGSSGGELACQSDADCASGQACLSEGTCAAVTECRNDEDCRDRRGDVCIDGACVYEWGTGCQQDADCAANEACLADGSCATVCTSSTECPAGESCQALQGDPLGRSVCFATSGGCTTDADCAVDQACLADQSCADVCTADAECSAGELCQELQGDPEGRSVCFDSGVTTCQSDADCGANEACLSDGSCADVCTSDAQCPAGESCWELQGDPQGRSVCWPGQSSAGFEFLRIDDQTNPDSEGCQTGDNPGSDIFEVRVFDETGTEVAYGQGIGRAPGAGETNNANTDYTVVDASVPAGFCDAVEGNEFSPDTVVSLGCGGALFVEFVSISDGSPVAVEDGWTIVVGEFGPQCTTNPTPENQAVYACPDGTPRSNLTGDQVSSGACTDGVFLGTGSGGEIVLDVVL